nr:uncharacterized protein LOC112040009 [Quercus suber]
MQARPVLSFSNEDKAGTHQPHDDALVVTIQIKGYDVRRVLVDHVPWSVWGHRLKLKDLASYDLPLVGFDGKTVVPKGMIKLPVQVGSRVVEVNFIVVDAYSLYSIILARPWLHAMEVVSSILYLKVKYPFRDQIRS